MQRKDFPKNSYHLNNYFSALNRLKEYHFKRLYDESKGSSKSDALWVFKLLYENACARTSIILNKPTRCSPAIYVSGLSYVSVWKYVIFFHSPFRFPKNTWEGRKGVNFGQSSTPWC